jgi:NAD(P)H dehydrogenase (quinone)
MEPVNAAVIYYSCTGTVHALAVAAAEGAERAGAARRAVDTAVALKAGRAAVSKPGCAA